MNLYQHQKKIISEDKKKTGLWLGTGSGKTRIALMMARGKTLVICPKTQKEDGNWERESESLEQGAFSLTVISKETFRRDHTSLLRFDTVIVDEAHTVAGVTPNTRQRHKVIIPKTSQLFEALEEFLQRTKPERLYLCTATPIRSPMTVWGLGKLLGTDWNFYKWREAFYIRLPMPGREVWSPKTDRESKDRLAKAVQKIGYTGQLSDYFDVPEQTYKTFHIELTAKQKIKLKELPLEYPDPLVLLGKKHQVENGVLAGDEFSDPEYFDNGKMEKILELKMEFTKMIIFVKYTQQIRAIYKMIQEKTVHDIFLLSGETKDRGEVLKEAQKSNQYVFICQAQVSSGWELPDCPVMVFASMSYSIVDRIQAEGRILRANHLKKNLYIDLVVKGGVDEAVADAIRQKKDFNERIYLNL